MSLISVGYVVVTEIPSLRRQEANSWARLTSSGSPFKACMAARAFS
ncbi:hypothetical protein [Streptomyces sp. WAC 01325]|nr:hypothetical protein [Streptomyces sp. WAC 01325]